MWEGEGEEEEEEDGEELDFFQYDNHKQLQLSFFPFSPSSSSNCHQPQLIQHPHRRYHIYYIPSLEPPPHHPLSTWLQEQHDLDQSTSTVGAPTDLVADSQDFINTVCQRRSLTHRQLVVRTQDAMNLSMIEDAHSPMPGSPPDLTGSKSSKSSSFHSSYQSDEGSLLADVNHFEDIGLGDDVEAELDLKSVNPYATAVYAGDVRVLKRPPVRMAQMHSAISPRELTCGKSRPSYPSLKGHVLGVTADPPGVGLTNATSNGRKAGFTMNLTPSLTTMGRRYRSPSPHRPIASPPDISASRLGPTHSSNPRRRSWQSTRDRKTQQELEKECDDEDGDDVPDECLLENVPISPRPRHDRAMSLPPSPDGTPKRERVRTAGNGTSPVPVEQGSLKPLSPAKSAPRGMSMGEFPIHHDTFTLKTRAKSWTAALSDLSEEAKALTEALELHADEQKYQPKQRRSRSSVRGASHERMRVRSLAELPPLRRTNIMIDPLPISKEKEAVLSRTRPSWLPPKNPNEEKRHLREYQRMMASAMEADRRREVQTHQRMACRDDTASSLLRIWEEHVLPNWDAVTSMKRTRELWWRGIAPRSRGRVWQRAVGNELELTDASFHAALSRAKALERKLARGESTREERRKGEWFAAIRRDVSMTYPELRIFQPGGPLCEPLVDVLMAYAMYRSDVGYVSGTNTITALLLLNLPTPQRAFITLSNILNRPLPLSFHTHDQGAISRFHSITLSTLSSKFPRLYAHLQSVTQTDFELNPRAYLTPLFSSLFTSHLDLDCVTRLWDVWVFEGDPALVRAAVATYGTLEGKLYGAGSKREVLHVLNAGVRGEEEKWMRAVRDAGRTSDGNSPSGSPTGGGNVMQTPMMTHGPKLSPQEEGLGVR